MLYRARAQRPACRYPQGDPGLSVRRVSRSLP